MTALILQARLDSSRLPQKSLLPLGGEPLLFRVMEALSTLNCAVNILACPEDCEEQFAPLACRAGFSLFTGAKEDVLKRYAAAARHFSIDRGKDSRVIRATGDNPFVFVDAALKINEEAAGFGADYAGYTGLPHGAGVESIRCQALLKADEEAVLPYEREHVCPYLYRDGGGFKLHRPLAPAVWQAAAPGHCGRITVDTAADYEEAVKLYAALNKTFSNANGACDGRGCIPPRFCGATINAALLDGCTS